MPVCPISLLATSTNIDILSEYTDYFLCLIVFGSLLAVQFPWNNFLCLCGVAAIYPMTWLIAVALSPEALDLNGGLNRSSAKTQKNAAVLLWWPWALKSGHIALFLFWGGWKHVKNVTFYVLPPLVFSLTARGKLWHISPRRLLIVKICVCFNLEFVCDSDWRV